MEGIEFMDGWMIFVVNIVIVGAPMIAGFYRQNEKIKTMENENQKLTELRDWLLPMLMNGQVTVGEAEKELGMVAEDGEEYIKK